MIVYICCAAKKVCQPTLNFNPSSAAKRVPLSIIIVAIVFYTTFALFIDPLSSQPFDPPSRWRAVQAPISLEGSRKGVLTLLFIYTAIPFLSTSLSLLSLVPPDMGSFPSSLLYPPPSS
jgi:hypothetical protein